MTQAETAVEEAHADGGAPFVWVWLALSAVPLSVAVWFVRGFSLAMPLFDHWTLLPILTRLSSGEFRFADLFGPHNGLHIAPFVKLFLAVLAALTGWSFRAEMFVGFALVTYTAFILSRAFEAALPGARYRETRAIVSLLTMGLLFSPAQDWIWTWSIGFFHYFENACVATVVWALSKRAPSLRVAVFGCVLATFNRFEGMFTWVLFLPALYFATLRVERKALAWIAWGAAGVLSCGSCIALLAAARPVELASAGPMPSASFVARFDMAASLAGMSAGFFTESHDAASFAGVTFVFAGVVLLVAIFAAGFALVKMETTRARAVPFLCCGGFGLAFASATALARQKSVSNAELFPLLRCYLSAYSATASLLAVATVHAVALFFAERAPPRGVSAVTLRRGAALLGVGILGLDYAHAAPRLMARRADGKWDHYCVELAPYFAPRSTCFMPPGGPAALARFRKERTDVAFLPEAPPAGRVEASFASTEPIAGGSVAAVSGSADLPSDSDGTVLLAFGDERRFVGQASQTASKDGRLQWIAKLPWSFVESDPRPLHAWEYDRERGVFRRLAGEAEPRRKSAPAR